jgi:hypothetical protein
MSVAPGDKGAPERATPPVAYIIDVCLFCGAHAVYPFRCGHRLEYAPWTMPIRVVPTASARASLFQEIKRREDALPRSGRDADPPEVA